MPDTPIDLAKVARYFALCAQTEDETLLSDEEYSTLSKEQVRLFYESGLGSCSDEVFNSLDQQFTGKQKPNG